MDLGCLDMGCIEKLKNQTSPHSTDSPVSSSSKSAKKKTVRDSHSSMNGLNKVTSQIRKPSRRKGSPINWFPRTKVESYLKRKIKLLQEVDGMNSTLDETLGDSNPHYSRVLREKIAVREAALKALEARKAALVEASWCRILKASRIESKEAETMLLKAENVAAEAFEAAKAIGVIMFDIPDYSQKHYEIETSNINGGETRKHTVRTSFETPFEVDKQVAAAVKAAFIKLVNCTSKDEIKEMLRKIIRNPDTDDINLEGFTSECESDAGSELESGSVSDNLCYQDVDSVVLVCKANKQKYRNQFPKKISKAKLVDMMLERLECLKDDELASLATIVATCGLSAALAEAGNIDQHSLGSASDYAPAANLPRRVSSFGTGNTGGHRHNQVETELPSLDKFLVKRLTRLEREVQEAKNSKSNVAGEEYTKRQEKRDYENVCSDNNTFAADLGSILVKRKSKLEREVEEARKNSGKMFIKDRKISNSGNNSSEVVPDLGSVLTKKHVSKLKQEIEEAKRENGKLYESIGKKNERANCAFGQTQEGSPEIPSLDKAMVKHMSRLEREVLEAKNGREKETDGRDNKGTNSSSLLPAPDSVENLSCPEGDQAGKENIDLNQINQEVEMKPKGIPEDCSVETSVPIEQSIVGAGEALTLFPKGGWENSLDKTLVSRLEKEKVKVLPVGSDDYSRVQRNNKKADGGSNVTDCESLDRVLVKHVSRLEKEKMEYSKKQEVIDIKRSRDTKTELENSQGSLDQILIKPKSRLERDKMVSAQQPDNQILHSATRRQDREKEMQQAWGGLSLGNSIRPHQSRLQREKAAWRKAEEEERMKATEHV